MVSIKNETEIDHIRASCRVVHLVQKRLMALIKPGITTKELDSVAETTIIEKNARPAFKGYNEFPASICASNNSSIVHGFPCDTLLCDGDLLSIDVGVEIEGYYGDGAFTVCVGMTPPNHRQFIETTKECLDLGIEKMLPGAHLGDVSQVIQQHAENSGYGIIREYGGHGIGMKLHEPPQINNYGVAGKGLRLKKGHVFCIEPILSMGQPDIVHSQDNWHVYTKDGSPAAHFEHTVAITEDGPEILTLPNDQL